MTAHTRATRRLTLQFVGQGLLDETEVNSQTADIASSPGSLAQLAGTSTVMPPPQVAPSAAPGKDVTPVPEAPKDMASHIEKVYADGAKFLADKEPTKTSAIPEHPVVQNPSNQGVSLQEISASQPDIKADTTLRKKRGRPRRNTVDISSPGQPSQAKNIGEIADLPNAPTPVIFMPEINPRHPQGCVCVECSFNKTPVAPAAVVAAPEPRSIPPVQEQAVASEPLKAAASVAPPPVSTLSPEKQKEYRERLAKYSQDILPKAGMMPSDGIGGITMKLRRFASLQVGGEVSKLTEEQFEDLFEFLDGYTAKNGATALVQYIDKAIGVTK
jgi:hypothetical protein